MADEAYYTVWHIVYITIAIPTVFGNGLILYSVARFKKLRSNIRILIANLAVSDLIVGAILIPTDMLSDFFGWKSNKYVCLSCLGMFVLSLGTSCYNLLLISIERFIAIYYPMRVKTIITKAKMVFMVSLGWLIVGINSSVPFYGVNNFTNSTECAHNVVWPQEYQKNCDWQLISALIVNFLFYAIVVRIALRKVQMGDKIEGNKNFCIHSKATVDLHHVITMVIVLGTFVICWLPYFILSVIVTFSNTSYYQFVKRCTLVPGLCNSAVNWLIYGYRNKEFRKAFKTILKWNVCCKAKSRSPQNVTSIYRAN
ncbi:histamine H1 receptor-like [Ruditapes philippinarum]|uniref:histamine H1 receptor-like n=1 Tax=Ruditapes philippinarum TaxID=129788 RepID=UPI00295A6714|nr:histamine H1 receptor-like [Ruditapes philippinarum]